jgi:hypothetical protein
LRSLNTASEFAERVPTIGNTNADLYGVKGPIADLCGEERAQFARRFTRIVLRKKMPALYRMSRHVVGPITPDAERSTHV